MSSVAVANVVEASRRHRYFVPTLLPALMVIIKHIKKVRKEKINK